MRSFPLFQIKYTPRSRCKVHKLAHEKIQAHERAVEANFIAAQVAAAAAQAEEEDEEEDEEEMEQYQGLELIENDEIINDDEEDEEEDE